MLFPLERLIDRPEKPDLICVRQNETIRDALECMIENDFTQLPVVDKDGDLFGIISEQRIIRMYTKARWFPKRRSTAFSSPRATRATWIAMDISAFRIGGRTRERGLTHQTVTVWVYEGILKVEYQAVTLSKYRVELCDDRKHITEVSNPRVAETIFRSPQLTLFDLGPDEWLLYWKAPSYAPRRRRPPGSKMTQLILFEVPIQEKAAGAETASPFLRLVVAPGETEQG